MKILYIAYPLLPVSEASAGGAEQVLGTLECEMSRRGHETIVAACHGSRVAGRLFPTGLQPALADQFDERNREHRAAIFDLLKHERFDVIHDHSGSFFAMAGELDLPFLGTLHLPRGFYAGIDFTSLGSVVLNCVSESQRRTFADLANVAAVVQNGIRLDRFSFQTRKDNYLLWLGRICEEKGAHLAIEAARQAGCRLLLAGQVYPFSYHERYFAREIQSHLGELVEFIDSPSPQKKVELLSHAAALLIPAMAEETSSLVALEALACGTPVIAFRRGALAEIVQDGRNGFLVADTEEMAAAVHRLHLVSPGACRESIESGYSAERMASEYEYLYSELVAGGPLCGNAVRSGNGTPPPPEIFPQP